MSYDGKDTFYRQLQLDEETRKIIKWFRKVKKELLDDKVKEVKDEV
jgi:hypothetical protein